MTAADLAGFNGEWVDPISTTYHGWTVHELPPNGQGIAALEMLNIMEGFPLAEYGHNSTRALHTMIEAKKLAYADMIRYNADPTVRENPGRRAQVESVREDARGADQCVEGELQRSRRNAARHRSTARRISASSIAKATWFRSFRATTRRSDSGQDSRSAARDSRCKIAAACSRWRKGIRTCSRPHKRPVHTIIPAFMEKGDVRIAFGIMGGWNQAQAHAQFVSNLVDFGMNIQSAIDAPRFSKETFPGCDVNIEARIPEKTRAELTAMGHQLIMRGDFSATRMGSGQAVMRDFATGTNFGASDPRKDGAAVMELHRAPQK